MRDHSDLGSATIASSVTIPRQTDLRADQVLSLLTCDPLRIDGQLPAIQQRNTHQSGQQRGQQDPSLGV